MDWKVHKEGSLSDQNLTRIKRNDADSKGCLNAARVVQDGLQVYAILRGMAARMIKDYKSMMKI